MNAAEEREKFSRRLRAALDRAGWKVVGATALAREFNRRSPGQPVTAHWGLPDPAAARDADAAAAFQRAHALIVRRTTALLQLPVETMGRDELKQALDRIGSLTGEEAHA